MGEVDTVGDILNVAVSVLQDYDDDFSATRIARMARWIILNLGVDICERQLGPITRIATDEQGIAALQIGREVVLLTQSRMQALTQEVARQLATSLFIAVERSES